jgi:hypothetical protein
MWAVASHSKVKKALHHISINPHKDERITDEQVLKIVERCEQKYGYKPANHQRVIVEHIKDGRQHFHVIWNRVSLATGKAVWPGHHWKKSKQASREMEKELGLRRVVARRMMRARALAARTGRTSKIANRYQALTLLHAPSFGPLLPYPKTSRGKTGKGDGAGGGASSTASALKTARKPIQPVKKHRSKNKGNGPERRRKNIWVAVERRRHKLQN